jgi:hypothetical protein
MEKTITLNNDKKYPPHMRRHRDLIQLLLIVIIGMFIPFLFSLIIVFHIDISSSQGWMSILSTFGYFLLVFAIELGVVFLYFYLTNKIAEQRMEKKKKD